MPQGPVLSVTAGADGGKERIQRFAFGVHRPIQVNSVNIFAKDLATLTIRLHPLFDVYEVAYTS